MIKRQRSAFVRLAQDLLTDGCHLRFSAEGSSMRPAIEHGDVLTVEPIDVHAIAAGDIVLYRGANDRPIAHRVTDIRSSDAGTVVLLRGDAKKSHDAPVRLDRVLGKVVAVKRANRCPRPRVNPLLARRVRIAAQQLLLSVACIVVAAAPAAAQVISGSYTGTGVNATQISGIGFQPDVLIIKGDTAQLGVIRTSSMTGDNTKPMTAGDPLTAGLIESITATPGLGAFTIGTDARVNTLNASYYFMAFKAVAGKLAVGSYTGDGTNTHAITGLGFTPALVIIMAATAVDPVFRTSASTSTCDFANGACNTTQTVKSLDADGFSVGRDSHVNTNGTTYYYAAWNAVANEMAVGSYSGNAADDRNLTVGFEPEMVLTRGLGARYTSHHTASLGSGSDLTLGFIASGATVNIIQALLPTGFQVGTDGDVNANGTTYMWASWARVNLETAVKMMSSSATRHDRGTYVQWRTGYEADNLGFHVYREHDGVRTRVTPSLIAGSGLLVTAGASTSGHSYGWWDLEPQDPTAKITYWIEDIDLDGTATMHGPIKPAAAGSHDGDGDQSTLLERLAKKDDRLGGVILPDAVRRLHASVEANASGWKATGRPAARATVAGAAPDGARRTATVTVPEQAGAMAASDSSSAAATSATSAPASPNSATSRGSRRSDVSHALQMQQTIAEHAAVKVSVQSEGWYRVARSALAGLGIGTDLRRMQLFVDGIQQPLKVTSDGIEFYGTGVDTPYTDTRVYWLRDADETARRVGTVDGRTPAASAAPGAPAASSFPYTIEKKDRFIYFAALNNGDAENFFGDLVMSELTDEFVSVARLDPNGGAAVLEVALQGVTETPGVHPNHRVGVFVNGEDVGELAFDGRSRGVQLFTMPATVLLEGDNVISLLARGGDDDISLVDAIRLTYPRTFTADGERLRFIAAGQQVVSVNGFGTSDIRIVDITDPGSIVEVSGTIATGESGFSTTFRVPGAGARTLLAFSSNGVATPAAIAANHPSSWHRPNHAADYVLVSHTDFIDALAPLKTLREGQGHSTAVVDIEDVYDEFGFGQKTPYALRDFLIRAHAAWRKSPQYVALVGNATTDPRNYLGMNEPDYLPTKSIPTPALETASDDWFGDADGDGFAELAAIGRLPARSGEQAAEIVRKIVAYEQSPAEEWSRSITLVADQSEQGDVNFAAATEELRPLVPAQYSIGEILRGQLGTADARTALLDRINRGQAIVNYSGHGSVQIWRDNLFTTDDVPALTNGARLPLFVVMNCLNGFFQGLFPEESLAESLVRAGNGGAIAVWASSGFTDPGSQAELNRAFFRTAFAGGAATLGDIISAAKKSIGDGGVRRTWILFGDPATRLKGLPDQPVARPTLTTNRLVAPPEAVVPGAALPAGAPRIDLLPGMSTPTRLADWDGDGRDDVFLYASKTWSAILSSGSRISGVWDTAWEPYPADLNGDGIVDLVLFDRASGTWAEAINDGAVNFTYTYGTWGTDWNVNVADLNGDGMDDVLLTNGPSGVWMKCLSDGIGHFTLWPGSASPFSSVTMGDFNADGRADAFLFDAETGVWTLAYSDGLGGFSYASGQWAPAWAVSAANLNGDAAADLLLYNPNTGASAECVTAAGGQFTCRGGVWARDLTVALLDGNGRDDVLLYNSVTGAWMLLVNSPGTVRSVVGTWLAGLTITTGDLDGDGRRDVVMYDARSGVRVIGITTAPGRLQYSPGQWSPGWSLAVR